MDKSKIIGVFMLIVCVYCSGIYTGYIAYGNKNNEIVIKENEAKYEDDTVGVAAVDENKIDFLTKIIYKYYYVHDDSVEVKEGNAPYFLIGKDRSEIEKCMPEWEVESFSGEKVILLKRIDKKEISYVERKEKSGNVQL